MRRPDLHKAYRHLERTQYLYGKRVFEQSLGHDPRARVLIEVSESFLALGRHVHQIFEKHEEEKS